MRLTDEQIGAELHALRATPEESFASRLDQRVAAGFLSEQRARKPERTLTWGRLIPVLGALATIAVVAVVISSNNHGVDLQSRGGSDGAAPSESVAPAPRVQSSGKEVSGLEMSAPGLTATSARPRNGHAQVQERSASLGLATDADKLEDAANGVVDVADRYDGIVDSSSVRAGGSDGHASVALRIPTQHLNDAMTDLSDLGRVTTRDTGSANVTGSYVDAGKAFKDARAKVESLEADLASASARSEAASIRQQLVIARQQLAAARAALGGLKQRVAYTPVSVQITAQGDGSWTIGDAADDAGNVLVAIGGALLIALAVLVPLAALIALGVYGTRELNRRRREATLNR
jgi:hypothetical protein